MAKQGFEPRHFHSRVSALSMKRCCLNCLHIVVYLAAGDKDDSTEWKEEVSSASKLIHQTEHLGKVVENADSRIGISRGRNQGTAFFPRHSITATILSVYYELSPDMPGLIWFSYRLHMVDTSCFRDEETEALEKLGMCPRSTAHGQSDQDWMGFQTLTSYCQAVLHKGRAQEETTASRLHQRPFPGLLEMRQALSNIVLTSRHKGFSRLRDQWVGSRLDDRGYQPSQGPTSHSKEASHRGRLQTPCECWCTGRVWPACTTSLSEQSLKSETSQTLRPDIL